MKLIKATHHLSDLLRSQDFFRVFLKRWLFSNFFIALLLYSGLMLNDLSKVYTILWLGTGTATAFIFIRGLKILPGIGLGSFCAYYFSHAGGILAGVSAALIMLQSYLLWEICRRYCQPSLLFYQIKFFLLFILISGVIAFLISFSLLWLLYSPPMIFLVALNWGLADFSGIIIGSLAIYAWDAYFPEIEAIRLRQWILMACFFALTVLLSYLFIKIVSLPLKIALFIFMLFLSYFITNYIGWFGSLLSLFLAGFSLTMLLIAPINAYLSLQFLLISMTLVGLLTRLV